MIWLLAHFSKWNILKFSWGTLFTHFDSYVFYTACTWFMLSTATCDVCTFHDLENLRTHFGHFNMQILFVETIPTASFARNPCLLFCQVKYLYTCWYFRVVYERSWYWSYGGYDIIVIEERCVCTPYNTSTWLFVYIFICTWFRHWCCHVSFSSSMLVHFCTSHFLCHYLSSFISVFLSKFLCFCFWYFFPCYCIEMSNDINYNRLFNIFQIIGSEEIFSKFPTHIEVKSSFILGSLFPNPLAARLVWVFTGKDAKRKNALKMSKHVGGGNCILAEMIEQTRQVLCALLVVNLYAKEDLWIREHFIT